MNTRGFEVEFRGKNVLKNRFQEALVSVRTEISEARSTRDRFSNRSLSVVETIIYKLGPEWMRKRLIPGYEGFVRFEDAKAERAWIEHQLTITPPVARVESNRYVKVESPIEPTEEAKTTPQDDVEKIVSGRGLVISTAETVLSIEPIKEETQFAATFESAKNHPDDTKEVEQKLVLAYDKIIFEFLNSQVTLETPGRVVSASELGKFFADVLVGQSRESIAGRLKETLETEPLKLLTRYTKRVVAGPFQGYRVIRTGGKLGRVLFDIGTEDDKRVIRLRTGSYTKVYGHTGYKK